MLESQLDAAVLNTKLYTLRCVVAQKLLVGAAPLRAIEKHNPTPPRCLSFFSSCSLGTHCITLHNANLVVPHPSLHLVTKSIFPKLEKTFPQ